MYIRHHAIVVTTYDRALMARAHKKATELFEQVSPVIASAINGYHSFFVPPDGNSETCDESDVEDANRDVFVHWLDSQRYEDGSTALKWVEVLYGDELGACEVVRHNAQVTRG